MRKRQSKYKKDAASLVASAPFLRDQNRELVEEGFTLNPVARVYARRNGTFTVQFTWLRRVIDGNHETSQSHTITVRGVA